MEDSQLVKPGCRYGYDGLHRQLYSGKNHLLTRVWLKHILFNCHYGMVPCGYDSKS